jgi:tetratricopeptide (TPR) repeat protein
LRYAYAVVLAGLTRADDALPGIPEGDLANELQWGVRRFFERRAMAQPLVLVFEDIHWAESRLVQLIEHLAEWSRGPLLVLCLARPDFRDGHPTFGGSAAGAATVTLEPLGADDTRRLVSELLATEALPESLRAAAVTRAEGNPLYVEEFLRTLIETNRIAQRKGQWIAVSDPTQIDVPPTLIGLITARLDRMRPDVRQLLQRASIIGRLFSTTDLEAISGEPVPVELLRDAVDTDLLSKADEQTVGAGQVYRFRHVLIRDVAYATASKGERARLHDTYSGWLEITRADRKDEIAEIVAFHDEVVRLARATRDPELIGAGLVARASGWHALGDPDRSNAGLVQAHEHLAKIGATRTLLHRLALLILATSDRAEFSRASRYLAERRAVQATQPSKLEQATIALFDGIIANEIGDFATALRDAEVTVAVSREAGVPSTIGSGLWFLGETLSETGDLARARSSLEAAIAIFGALRSRDVLGEVHARCARACVRLGDLIAARHHAAAAEQHRLPNDPRAAQIAGVARAELGEAEGDLATADAWWREALASLASSGFEERLGWTELMYGSFLVRHGRDVGAREQLNSARARYRDPLAYRRVAQIDALLAKASPSA